MRIFACPIIGCETDNSYIIWLIIFGVIIISLLTFLVVKTIKKHKK